MIITSYSFFGAGSLQAFDQFSWYVKEFLITILHEIYHAMDAKRYGWKKFKEMYEYEMNLMIAKGKDEYKDNKYEIEAEKFGQKNWSKWKTRFKKEGLI